MNIRLDRQSKWIVGLTLLLMLALPLATFADTLHGDDLDTNGNTSKVQGEPGTAQFWLTANGNDGCNVDATYPATVQVSSNQSWLTIDAPTTVSISQCGNADTSVKIGYTVSSTAPVGGVAKVSGQASGGLTTSNGYNVVPASFTVTVSGSIADNTPPVITLHVDGTLGQNGWYVT